MKKISIAIVLVSIFGSAQDVKIPVAGVKYGNEKMKNDSLDGKMKTLDVFLNLPLVKSEENKVVMRIGFQQRNISEMKNELYHQNLKGIDAAFVWNHRLNEDKGLTFISQPGFYSDFENFSMDDFRFRIAVSYMVKHSERFNTGWGIAYAYQFFGHQLNPFVVINYDFGSGSRWKLSGLLPIMPKLTYTLNENLSWNNELSGKVESYRFSQSDTSYFMEISGWNATSNLDWTIKKHHRLSFGVGYILRQNTKIFENGDRNDWKIFTFDLSEKNKPISETTTRGFLWNIGYSFAL